jgi:hypothetical protein
MPDVACENTVTEAALAIATEQLGVHEAGGSNRGEKVELYLASVGLLPGQPWCAAALFYCFRLGAGILKTPNPCPRTGSALHVWSLADRHFRTAVPRRGCVYVVDHGKGQGHTGIIEEVDAEGLVTELSGNTNSEGSREGNAFERHRWNWHSGLAHGGTVVGYLDFALVAPAPAALVA